MQKEKSIQSEQEGLTRREALGAIALGVPALISACKNGVRNSAVNVLGPAIETKKPYVPLVDPHIHSDCAHSPESIHRISKKYNITAFGFDKSVEQVVKEIRCPPGNFKSWYACMAKTRATYISPKVIGELIEDVINEQASSGVELLELRISILSTIEAFFNNLGMTPNNAEFWKYANKVFDQILQARQKTDQNNKMKTDLVVSLSCHKRFDRLFSDTAHFCRDYRGDIVGTDLTHEQFGTLSKVKGTVESIRSDVKGLTMHCMETTEAKQGWAALELNPDRIGHGVHASSDQALMKKYAEKGIPFEICVRSNLVTGIYKKLADHPMRKLYEAGIPLMVASDGCNDGSTLSDNYKMVRDLGFSDKEIDEFRANGWKYAFRNLPLL